MDFALPDAQNCIVLMHKIALPCAKMCITLCTKRE